MPGRGHLGRGICVALLVGALVGCSSGDEGSGLGGSASVPPTTSPASSVGPSTSAEPVTTTAAPPSTVDDIGPEDASGCLTRTDPAATGPWEPNEDRTGLPLETVDHPLPAGYHLPAGPAIVPVPDEDRFIAVGEGAPRQVGLVAAPGCKLLRVVEADGDLFASVHFFPTVVDLSELDPPQIAALHVTSLQHIGPDGEIEVLDERPQRAWGDRLVADDRWVVTTHGAPVDDGIAETTLIAYDLRSGEGFTVPIEADGLRDLQLDGDTVWFQRFDRPGETDAATVRFDLTTRQETGRYPNEGREICLMGDRVWVQGPDGSVAGFDPAAVEPPIVASVSDTWELACTDSAIFVTVNLDGDTRELTYSNPHVPFGSCTTGWAYQGELHRIDPANGQVTRTWPFTTGRSPSPSTPRACDRPWHPRLGAWGDRLVVDQFHLLDESS